MESALFVAGAEHSCLTHARTLKHHHYRNNSYYSNLKHSILLLLFSYMPSILYSCMHFVVMFVALITTLLWPLRYFNRSYTPVRPLTLNQKAGSARKRPFTASTLPSDPSLPTFKRATSKHCCRIRINERGL
jgi:hypothetical protein